MALVDFDTFSMREEGPSEKLVKGSLYKDHSHYFLVNKLYSEVPKLGLYKTVHSPVIERAKEGW